MKNLLLVGILLAFEAGAYQDHIYSTSRNKVENLKEYIIDEKLDEMADSDEEIMKQHEQLFKKLEQPLNYN